VRFPNFDACIRVGVGTLGALTLLVPNVLATDATEIFDTVTFGEPICTIDIVGGDVTVCSGGLRVYEASLECADGYERSDDDPQWFLDGSPVGTGDELSLSIASPGIYTLSVECGACSDQIMVEAIDCVNQPLLDAVFSDNDTEGTVGIFMQPNISAVSQLNFPSLKYYMRPFTLSADPDLADGGFEVSVSGDAVLQAWTPAGTQVSLPTTYDVSELPVTFYVNATGFGEALVTASYVSGRGGETTDEVLVRVGPFPGLSGDELAEYPYFHHVDTFNEDGVMQSALDPVRHAERVGLSYRVYVVEHKSTSEWADDPSLTDVSGGFETTSVVGSSIGDNVVDAWTAGLDPGALVSKDYDIVYDFGLDGNLDPGDLIDGLKFSGAGAYVVKDLVADGPYTVAEATYSGGTWLGQNTFYPTNIGSLGEVPLVIMSHGNGHNYQWYDYLGQHLASHGYVFMSHQNQTGPGIETASTTTLTNTDYFLDNLGTIAGGVLQGHIDTDRIIWSGHSRGGEGVVRAYDRVVDGTYVPDNYTEDDIVLVSSIAPTVFLNATASDPHDVNYHVIGAAGDGDVSGDANCAICQYFRLAGRATGTVMSMYPHGTDHNDYNCCGFNDYTGPGGAAQIGREEAQRIARSYYLALSEYFGRNNPATKEYLTRMFDDLRPIGIADNEFTEVALTYGERDTPGNFVIDDYQDPLDESMSSSGGTVTFDVSNLFEGDLNDNNSTYTWMESDPMNGMTDFSGSGDFARGVVFDYTVGQQRFVEFEITEGNRDVRDFAAVSFRACQGTRHPETVALDDDHSFSVTLRDGDGTSSTIHFGAWGELTELFQRTGSGTGAGWVNEFNTVRVPITAFEADGSGIDLSNVVALRLEFGSAFGSPRGRIGLDDVQFTLE
jgi:hypothetical protein